MMCMETLSAPRCATTNGKKASLFDDWVQASLRQRFDEAFDEPLSEDLLAVLAEQPEPRNDH